MVDLYSQGSVPFRDGHLAVVITGSEAQRHTGFFFRTADNAATQFLHLAFHYQLALSLADQWTDGELCWLPMRGFSNDEQLMIAQWLETIWEINGAKIPYGLNYSSGQHFNSQGAYLASDDDGGLTCATFVLAALEHVGYNLIDTATSYTRDSDRDWHEKIIGYLARRATPEYVERQRHFLGIAARYRPEEVAGAAFANSGDAIQFDTAIELGEQVLQAMRANGTLKADN